MEADLMPDSPMRTNTFKRIISPDLIKLCLAQNLKKTKPIQYFPQSVANIVIDTPDVATFYKLVC